MQIIGEMDALLSHPSEAFVWAFVALCPYLYLCPYLPGLTLYISVGQGPKAPNKIAADDILIFYFYLLKKIRLDFYVNPLLSRGFT